MKQAGFISTRKAAGVAAALTTLTVLPTVVSAQAIIGYRRPNNGGPAMTSAPPQSVPVPSVPARSGVFSRPTGMPPQSNRNGGSNFNGSAFNGSAFNGSAFNGSVYRNPRPSGPVVVLPDGSGQAYDYRHHGSWQQPSLPVGTANVFTNNSLPPIGPANGFFTRPIPPVGPANGFFNSTGVNSPVFSYGQQGDSRRHHRGNDSNYGSGYAPPLLGGYYYGNYCNTAVSSYTYPSVYRSYAGFPAYLYNPAVIVITQPYIPAYETPFLPFYTPSYPVTYNQTNYYVTNESRAQDLEAGGVRAKDALRHAYPADSYQAAFGDIARAWMDGTLQPLRKHIRDSDTRISVFLDKKYSYSIASDDFVQITRDALDRLNTVSFDFTRLRKAKNGDVTAYGIHVYRAGSAGGADSSQDSGTVPFDESASDNETTSPYDKSADPGAGQEKTVYVSYTLRRHDTQWYIISVDSSDQEIVPEQ